jgi:hypothetical protein
VELAVPWSEAPDPKPSMTPMTSSMWTPARDSQRAERVRARISASNFALSNQIMLPENEGRVQA